MRWEAPAQNPNGIPASSPGLARGTYPGNVAQHVTTPTGLRPLRQLARHNPVGVGASMDCVSQGSSFLATLGWRPKSRWDSPFLSHLRRPA